MESTAKLLEAFASLLWPVLAISVVWFSRESIRRVIESWAWRKSTLKVGDFEVSVEDYSQQQRDLIGDLQEKIISLEGQIGGPPKKPEQVEREPARVQSVLWVDDHPENHIQIIEQLNNREISVVQVKTTDDALERMATSKFDFIITDMHRIEFGKAHREAGMELIKAVREQSQETPIIVFYGRSSRGTVLRDRDVATSAGANLVTSSPTELLSAIEMPNKLLKSDAR